MSMCIVLGLGWLFRGVVFVVCCICIWCMGMVGFVVVRVFGFCVGGVVVVVVLCSLFWVRVLVGCFLRGTGMGFLCFARTVGTVFWFFFPCSLWWGRLCPLGFPCSSTGVRRFRRLAVGCGSCLFLRLSV